jgi:HlyD family secretion protein
MTIADMSVLLAEVEVSEVDVVDVALGQKAEVKVDALGTEPQHGRVVEIATSGRRDPTQGTIRFRVKVAITDPDPSLRPAMTAKVDILTATSGDAVTVPIQAVVKRKLDDEGNEVRGSAAKGIEDSDVVYVIEEGKATIVAVETGISDELYVEIVDGLDEGQEVITGPYRTLKNLKAGDAVRFEQPKGEEGEDGEEEESGSVEVRVE